MEIEYDFYNMHISRHVPGTDRDGGSTQEEKT